MSMSRPPHTIKALPAVRSDKAPDTFQSDNKNRYPPAFCLGKRFFYLEKRKSASQSACRFFCFWFLFLYKNFTKSTFILDIVKKMSIIEFK